MVKICLNRFLLFETVKINENFVHTLYVIIKLHIQGVFDVEVFLLM
jgi:cytochrome b